MVESLQYLQNCLYNTCCWFIFCQQKTVPHSRARVVFYIIDIIGYITGDTVQRNCVTSYLLKKSMIELGFFVLLAVTANQITLRMEKKHLLELFFFCLNKLIGLSRSVLVIYKIIMLLQVSCQPTIKLP